MPDLKCDGTVTDWEELEQRPSGKFRCRPFYDASCDAVMLFIADDESYCDRVHPLLTLYRSIATGDVVGCRVKLHGEPIPIGEFIGES